MYLEGTTPRTAWTTPPVKDFLSSLSDEELLFLENVILNDDAFNADPLPTSTTSPPAGITDYLY